MFMVATIFLINLRTYQLQPTKLNIHSEAYLEHSRTPKMKLFVNCFILDVWLGFELVSVQA